ncbi:MAG: ribonuclease D [Gammaproteobacteria bacterium]
MSTAIPFEYIDTADGLSGLCDRLAGVPWIAIDTEFLREKTYYPKLCLLQLAVPGMAACIDPLALDDLTPVTDLLFDERIVKVMHAGRQDMEIIYHLTGRVPAPVFDTQIAAPLLGYPDQVGYGNLVKSILNVTLDKLHTRDDWSRRPLTPEQVRYAADDVIFLVDVYRALHERLASLDRLAWLAADFRHLSDPALYENPPELAWLKVKGGNRLRGASLAVLQALAGWREEESRERDRPKGWVLRDDAMVDIARHRPATLDALKRIRGLNERLLARSGQTLVELVVAAAQTRPQPFPDQGSRTPLTTAQDAMVDVLMAVVRLSAAENDLSPTVLASRKQLEQLVQGSQDSGVMQGWRKPLIGDRLTALLDGQLTLGIHNGQLVVQPPVMLEA